jgi:SOS-response transcriptional repressor LexA
MQAIIERIPSTRVVSLGRLLDTKEMLAVLAPDDSMVDQRTPIASIHKGDDVVIEYGCQPRPGQIALIFDPVSREHLFRRASFKSRTVISFEAADHAFPPVELPADSKHILGVVRAIQRILP